MRIFISHSFKDEDLAAKLKEIFERSDKIKEAYMAQRVKEYELEISEKITREIDNSDYVVAIVTKNTRASASVNQELGYAQGKNRSRIPMIEKTAKRGVLVFAKDAEYFTRDNFEQSCKTVLEYILKNGTKNQKPRFTRILPDREERFASEIWNKIPPAYVAIRNITIIPLDPQFTKIQFNKEIIDNLQFGPRYFKISSRNLIQDEFHYIGDEIGRSRATYGIINERGHMCFQEIIEEDRRISLERATSFLISTLEYALKFYKSIGYDKEVSIRYNHHGVEKFLFGSKDSFDEAYFMNHVVQKSSVKMQRITTLDSTNISLLVGDLLEELARACNWAPQTGMFTNFINNVIKDYFFSLSKAIG